MTREDVIAARRAELMNRIEHRTGGRAVSIVAVTKGQDVEVAVAAAGAGLADLGENYAQELLAKQSILAGRGLDVRWHFIGRLQRNKVRALAPHVSLWQSIDRRPLVDEIARHAPGAPILVQLNLAADPRKGGCGPADLDGLIERSTALGLDVRGLMGVGVDGDERQTRAGFDLLVREAERRGLPERSIGMSADLDWALDAGATMIRIGRALLGERPP